MSRLDELRGEAIRAALGDCLSGAERMPSQRAQVLQAVRGEASVRRGKLPAVVALAIVLTMLAAAGMAAAWLSGREMVDGYAVPMARQSVGDAYTAEQTRELVAMAEANGIVLSDNAKSSIDRFLAAGEGYWKEELIMAIAKAEFGDMPAAWTLEQQNWFDDVCVAIGFIDEKNKAMPGGGEAAAERIIALADAYIHETYAPGVDLHDPAMYKETYKQYIDGDVDGEYPGMYWAIAYEAASLEASEYAVYLRDDGTVLGDWVHLGAVAGARVDEINDAFRRVYGSNHGDWSQSVLRAYRDAVLAGERLGFGYAQRLMELTAYPDIAPEAISRERAHELACEALGQSEASAWSATYIGDEPNPVWKVIIGTHSAEIDSVTGEVKSTHDFGFEGGMTYWDLALERVREQVQAEEDAWIEENSVG